MTIRLTLTRPDDWHLHLRDGAFMSSVAHATARCFARALVMPNLKPPITTVTQALAYRERIYAALAVDYQFEPLMTLYLTENTALSDIIQIKDNPNVLAIKYYPAGATTHSESGIAHWQRVIPVLEAMQKYDIPLTVHGEVVETEVDVFDREPKFIDTVLAPLVRQFPALRIVLEHITTREAVDFVLASNQRIAATITAHHLLLNRNALFNGGIRPHHYCLPILKRESHRQALLQAATSGNPKFFLGTDSAPHAQSAKETACGCAGIYTAPAALAFYAEAFEQMQALDKLEGFASFFGADFYQLPRNTGTITLEKQAWQMPDEFTFGENKVIPFRADEMIEWR